MNYSAYQMRNPGTAEITLLYYFTQMTGSGILNLSSTSWGALNQNSYGACESSNNATNFVEIVNTNFRPANEYSVVPVDECGVYISASRSNVTYSPNQFTEINFTITVLDRFTTGDYLFFPAGGGCGYSIPLIVGSSVPSKVLHLDTMGCHWLKQTPNAIISVVGVENLTGLNLPG